MQKKSQRGTTKGSDVFVFGKVPPQAVEIEVAVLGSLLIESKKCAPTVFGLLSADMFYKQDHGLIFDSCRFLYDKNEPIDLLTVSQHMKSIGKLDEIGGAYYISILTNGVSSSYNIETHCRIIIEKYMKREVIRASTECVEMAYDESVDSFECIGFMEHSVSKINEVSTVGNNLKDIGSITRDVEASLRQREKLYKEGKCTGVRTGIRQLDKITSGWQNSELIILAGRPSMGKTALMLHHALSSGVNCCIYSLEMSDVSLVNRMILSLANINPGKFNAGAMAKEDWDEFYRAKDELSRLPIYIDDNPLVTTRYIKSHSKMMRDKGRCDIIFVDYLQLADMRSDQSGRNREQEVSQAAREFKIIAKTLDVPVILLSQLSRECEKRADKRPMLSDLRESGAIEQDADIVMFAYRPDYYGLTDKRGESQSGIGYEIIAKGRNVGTGEVPFRHNESMTKIYDYDDNFYKQDNPF